MIYHCIKQILYLLVFLLIETILISCVIPTRQNSIGIGDADFGHTSSNVGSNPNLPAPLNLKVLNNETSTETALSLQWDYVSGASAYALYRAVYPTLTQTQLEDKAFKFFTVIKGSTNTHYDYQIPHIPLRRYAFRVTAIDNKGESYFSSSVDGWRLPLNEEEALKDIDYTIHFAQSQISGFGSSGKNVTLSGRGCGTYVYSTPILGKLQSKFSSYADFETIINGDPQMQITLSPVGIKMNGSLDVSGLYKATLTYIDLQGVEGGLTKGGEIKISYQHPHGLKEKNIPIRKLKYLCAVLQKQQQKKPPVPQNLNGMNLTPASLAPHGAVHLLWENKIFSFCLSSLFLSFFRHLLPLKDLMFEHKEPNKEPNMIKDRANGKNEQQNINSPS